MSGEEFFAGLDSGGFADEDASGQHIKLYFNQFGDLAPIDLFISIILHVINHQ